MEIQLKTYAGTKLYYLTILISFLLVVTDFVVFFLTEYFDLRVNQS